MKVKYFHKLLSNLEELEKEVNEWLENQKYSFEIDEFTHIPTGEGMTEGVLVMITYQEIDEESDSDEYSKPQEVSVTVKLKN